MIFVVQSKLLELVCVCVCALHFILCTLSDHVSQINCKIKVKREKQNLYVNRCKIIHQCAPGSVLHSLFVCLLYSQALFCI